MLAQVAEQLKINSHLLLSRGEAKDTGRARKYIMANAMEALIGAIYLDQGYQKTSQFIEREILKKLPKLYTQDEVKDPIAQVKFFTPSSSFSWFIYEYDGKVIITFEEYTKLRFHLFLNIDDLSSIFLHFIHLNPNLPS